MIARNLDDETLLVHALGGGALPFAGGMATLLAMETPDLARELHLGPAGAQRFAAAVELGRRAAVAEVELPKSLCGGGDVAAWLRPRVAGEHTECFYAIYLTAKGGVVNHRRISEGTLTASLVHPREVFAPAIMHRAAAVIVAHNHPSGDPYPSAEDRATTARLKRAGSLLGVKLLDHVVVAGGRYTSFLEQGWL